MSRSVYCIPGVIVNGNPVDLNPLRPFGISITLDGAPLGPPATCPTGEAVAVIASGTVPAFPTPTPPATP